MKDSLRGRRGSVGFTIVELMVALAVLAILATVTAPSYSNLIRESRVNSQASEIINLLRLARSEAMSHKTDTFVCGFITSGDKAQCITDYSGGIRVLRSNEVVHELTEIPESLIIDSNHKIHYTADGTVLKSALISIKEDDALTLIICTSMMKMVT